MHPALRTLREEHAALHALLRTVLLLLAESRASRRPPDFTALRAMLFYIAEFPERRHHLKESQLLFPLLRARTPVARALLDRLDDEHDRGMMRIREIEHALTAYEMLGASHAETFERAMRRYVAFYEEHMTLEEDVILPLAERVLTEDDWLGLDEEMTGEPDPLTGRLPDDEYRALFDRILAVVPAPFGFATPIAATA